MFEGRHGERVLQEAEDGDCRLGGVGAAREGKRGNILEQRNPDTRRGRGGETGFSFVKVHEKNRKAKTQEAVFMCV